MNKNNIFIAVLALFSIISCQKDKKIISSTKEIKFNASYNIGMQAKASTFFTTGNKVSILGYPVGASVASAQPVPGTPVDATGGTSGSLNPVTALYLPKGTYDFYSVSINNINSPGLIFTSGISGILANGTDYLWAKTTGISNGGTASFNYVHKAVGIEINVTAGSGLSEMAVTAISITPTTANESSRMNLADGVIGAASSVGSTLVPMSLSGTKGTFIMLPVNSVSVSVEVTINAIIGGTQVTSKKYTATIPPQAYASGSYYTADFTVNSTAIKFEGALVQDWASQTISGATLIEI